MALEQVGVIAAVEAISSFLGDMRKVNSSLDDLRPTSNLLESAFNWLTESIGKFGREILNVAETALGVLLRDAIRAVVGWLGDLLRAIFETGSAFQLLQLRLQGFNLQDAINSGMEYEDAMRNAIDVTQEQLSWIMKIAAVTPFDAADIANIYSLARSYGFTREQAEPLIVSINDFTSAMGLSSTEAERIIVNLGQMVQRGKVTTREMNDLARGGFVPISNILERMADNMGITTQELMKMISTVDGVPADQFIRAFEEMTTSEERFNGAAQRMARTFKGASQNIIQTVQDLLGFYIVVPVLDVVGSRLADIMDQITEEKTWGKITEIAGSIGQSLAGIVQDILDLLPGAGSITDIIIEGLQNLDTWIKEHRDDIVGFFEGLFNILSGNEEGVEYTGILGGIQDVVDFINNSLIPAFNTIKDWVIDNKDLIGEFFGSIGEIVGMVFENIFGKKKGGVEGESGLEKVLKGIKGFLQWVVDHEEEIATFVTNMVILFGSIALAAATVDALVSGFMSLLGLMIGLINPINMVKMSFAEGLITMSSVVLFLRNLPSKFEEFKNRILSIDWYKTGQDLIRKIINGILAIASNLADTARNIVNNAVNSISDSKWYAAGRSLIQGLINGIGSMGGALWSAAWDIAKKALAALMAALGVESPSKEFMKVGKMSIQGLVKGLVDNAGMVEGAMGLLAGRTLGGASAIPGMAYYGAMAPSMTSNYNNTYNNILNIHTAANSEPIIADFAMLQSLQGV